MSYLLLTRAKITFKSILLKKFWQFQNRGIIQTSLINSIKMESTELECCQKIKRRLQDRKHESHNKSLLMSMHCTLMNTSS